MKIKLSLDLRAALRSVVGLAVPLLLLAFCGPQACAVDPSFTFTASEPSQVVEGATFTFPATVTDTGGPASNFNTFFQIYDQNFVFVSQTFYTNQTFASGQTLDYNPTLTAPTDPSKYYWVATLMFDQDFTGPIVGQQFFLPTFTVVPAAPAPEPSSGLAIGLLGVAVMALKARLRAMRAGG